MDSGVLTLRQQRERDFYNQYARTHADTTVVLDPIRRRERRPWNSYWHCFELVQAQFRPGHRLLDLGCGWGSNTVVFAAIGYDVDAIDISEANLQAARRVASEHGVADRIRFHLMPAERLTFHRGSFDVVAGIDILHHVDIAGALHQCHRVLAPRGAAFFHEPIWSGGFDRLRNTAIARRALPNTVSLDRHITHDERKLDGADLALVTEVFPQCRLDRFRVLARLTALLPRHARALQKLDWQLKHLPGYESLCGTVVMALENGGAAA